ncbi:ABC transporter ATP-binding protein [Candidatus Dependentiae bacterium]|nr:ABC transporter ATP-binding protein [Candidatus Dependentiae bacterium]
MIDISSLTYKIKRTEILENLNFRIKQNDFMGLVGENGSGKTTLIRIVLGLIDGYDGTVRFDDDIRINYQPENTNKKLNLTVVEYLLSYCIIYQVKKDIIRESIKRVIDLLELKSEVTKKLNELSKGFLQRVSLARCLLNNPDFIILDEPFSNIDQYHKGKFIESILSLKGEKTLLIASHNLEEIAKICDRVLILRNKKAIEVEWIEGEDKLKTIKNTIEKFE